MNMYMHNDYMPMYYDYMPMYFFSSRNFVKWKAIRLQQKQTTFFTLANSKINALGAETNL